jgi:hypothetical protein
MDGVFKKLSNLGQLPPWERWRPRRLLWAQRADEDVGVRVPGMGMI